MTEQELVVKELEQDKLILSQRVAQLEHQLSQVVDAEYGYPDASE